MAKPRSAEKWDSLKPAYRARLERGGITRGKYLRGDSLSAGRGHAKTPEHPREAIKNPQKYPGYKPKKEPSVSKQDAKRLEIDAIRSMDSKLGFEFVAGIGEVDRFKYNPKTVRANVRTMTTSQKIWTIGASLDDLLAAASQRTTNNPWWYH